MTKNNIAICGAALIDGTGSELVAGSTVVVENDCITAVGPAETVTVPEGARRIDAAGKFLLPGLIELHSHAYHPAMVPTEVQEPEAYAVLYAVHCLRQALQAGITTVREVCQMAYMDLAVKRAVNEGLVPGPRLYASGKGICMTGGHGSDLEGFMIEADGVHEIVKAIREQKKRGVDLIKILTSHRDETPEYTQEEIDIAVRESHRLGLRVAVHAASRLVTDMVVKAGVDTVEHGTFVSGDTAKRMADQGTFWVPTCYVICRIGEFAEKALQSGMPFPPNIERELMLSKEWGEKCTAALPDAFEKILKAGVRIGAGTDAIGRDMVYASLPEEMEHLVQFGCTPLQAIESATRIGAEAIGVESKIGTIETGKLADMIMVDRDPLADITAVKSVTWVMKGGREVPFEKAYDRLSGKTPWA
ncbi:MAG: amidohydrolase family protein [Deltaproteobacteria bacterium]|nr:amidohydrolase family protein [Deltaproteobacteria bacterium]